MEQTSGVRVLISRNIRNTISLCRGMIRSRGEVCVQEEDLPQKLIAGLSSGLSLAKRILTPAFWVRLSAGHNFCQN